MKVHVHFRGRPRSKVALGFSGVGGGGAVARNAHYKLMLACQLRTFLKKKDLASHSFRGHVWA